MAVVVCQAELDIPLGRREAGCDRRRAQKLDVFNAELPMAGELDAHPHPPIELRPASNHRVVVLRPDVIPGAGVKRHAVDEG